MIGCACTSSLACILVLLHWNESKRFAQVCLLALLVLIDVVIDVCGCSDVGLIVYCQSGYLVRCCICAYTVKKKLSFNCVWVSGTSQGCHP